MARKKDRIILDTNLWISFLLSSNYSKLDFIFNKNLATLLFSNELLKEFIEVINRPKFKDYFEDEDLTDLLFQIESKAEFFDVSIEIDACRDAKDNFLLALAKVAQATHLITGDKDLLSMHKFEKTKIITLTEYLEKNIKPY